jgi:hypothetical protein
MKKNKLKELIEFVGLSYKKEMLKIALINVAILLAMVLVFLFSKNTIFLIIIFIGLLLLDFFLLTRYSDKKKMILKNRENELIAIISYFEVYIQNNNNVYQSFNQLIPYCSDWMKERIETLLKEIDEDKSVQPFVNFANNFQELSTHSLMLSIYQMVDQGENSEQLLQFNVIYDELAKNRNKEMIEQKDKSLSSMSTFPLIGAGLITVSLTISILSILGDLINVI